MIRRDRKDGQRNADGFTIVELLIVIVVIAILAAVSVVGYSGVQYRAATVVTQNTLKNANTAVMLEKIQGGSVPAALPSNVQVPDDVAVEYRPLGGHYSGLSPVQNGVLFQAICVQLINDPYYSVIHAKTGSETQSVVMRCSDNIARSSLLITGWKSETWSTPIMREQLQAYIDAVPYDPWWTDRQDVIRGFYSALISRFETQGGTWPITSFWDPWANEWSGVHKEELPPPDPGTSTGYCIQASHRKYQKSYTISSDNQTIREGTCA